MPKAEKERILIEQDEFLKNTKKVREHDHTISQIM